MQPRSPKSEAQSLAPEAFDVSNAVFDFVGRQRGAEFEDFDVAGFYARLERREIDIAGTRRTMVAPRKLHIMDVESSQMVAHRFQVKHMVDESEVFLDLGVARIVPIDEIRA